MPEAKKDNITENGFNIPQYIVVVGICCYIAFLFGKTGGNFKLFDDNLLKSTKEISKSLSKSTSIDSENFKSKEQNNSFGDYNSGDNADNLKINAETKGVVTSSGQKIPDIDVLVEKGSVEELKAPYEGALFLIAEISNDISDIKSSKSKLSEKQESALKIINSATEQLKQTQSTNNEYLKEISENENNFDGSFVSRFKYFIKDYVKIKKISTVKIEAENKRASMFAMELA